MTDRSPAQLATELAREWREARTALLELAERIPETRAYKATDRAGWTIKHELSHVLSLDAEVRHLLDGDHASATALRRLRGQAMHTAQELRLAPLRQQLAAAGEQTASAIESAAERLAAPVASSLEGIAELVGQEAHTAAEYVQARLQRSRQALQTVRDALG